MVIIVGMWCEEICHLHFCFSFQFLTFLGFSFHAFCASIWVASAEKCRNKCCFWVFHLGVFACSGGIDGMMSEQACHLHIYFFFSCLTFSACLILFLSALNRVAALKTCGNKCCFRFCVWAFSCVVIVLMGCDQRMHFITSYRYVGNGGGEDESLPAAWK